MLFVTLWQRQQKSHQCSHTISEDSRVCISFHDGTVTLDSTVLPQKGKGSKHFLTRDNLFLTETLQSQLGAKPVTSLENNHYQSIPNWGTLNFQVHFSNWPITWHPDRSLISPVKNIPSHDTAWIKRTTDWSHVNLRQSTQALTMKSHHHLHICAFEKVEYLM